MYAEKTRRMRREVRGMCAAHNLVQRSKKKGVICVPDECQKCGEDVSLQAHHDDYSKPLDVIWLCPVCHARRHVELGRVGGSSRQIAIK